MDSSEYHKHHLPRVKRLSKHLPPGFDSHALPGTYTRDHYEPNVVSRAKRIAYALIALAFLANGLMGVLVGKIWIPGRYTAGVTLTGTSLWFAFAAIVVGSVGLLSVILDHYDRRNNTAKYESFQRVSRILSLSLIVFALVWHVGGLLWGQRHIPAQDSVAQTPISQKTHTS